ncbi:hypothetical protein JG687_00004373 [Phytophthora cactorum]|uniref:Uncharacterized protein n=1 Tax=Phytophthora cactorum TaxID=29920 RepID=A0A8T1UQ12_9STRA|nr:hypothetical protein JG687_00004373 [Phytophthora cactorum]
MAAAFTFLSPVSHAHLPVTHVPPACTFTWTPVDPTSSRLHWTRSDAKLAPTPEPSTESTKSTKLQITSDQDQQLHQHTEDVPKSLIDDNALTKELYAKLLSLLAANDPQIATAVLHERHDAIAIAMLKRPVLSMSKPAGTKYKKMPEQLIGLLSVIDSASNAYSHASDAKTRRSNGPTARHTPDSAPTLPVLPRTDVTSRLFSYLKDATYLGHRADSKARRDQASAAATQRRWL